MSQRPTTGGSLWFVNGSSLAATEETTARRIAAPTPDTPILLDDIVISGLSPIFPSQSPLQDRPAKAVLQWALTVLEPARYGCRWNKSPIIRSFETRRPLIRPWESRSNSTRRKEPLPVNSSLFRATNRTASFCACLATRLSWSTTIAYVVSSSELEYTPA